MYWREDMCNGIAKRSFRRSDRQRYKTTEFYVTKCSKQLKSSWIHIKYSLVRCRINARTTQQCFKMSWMMIGLMTEQIHWIWGFWDEIVWEWMRQKQCGVRQQTLNGTSNVAKIPNVTQDRRKHLIDTTKFLICWMLNIC